MSGKRVIVHSLAEACATLAAARSLGVPVTLASAEGAGCHAGAPWFKALVAAAAKEFPDVTVEAVLDCGGEAGSALAALRQGCTRLRFAGTGVALERLREIAAEQGAEIETGAGPTALDLRGRRDSESALRAYLSAS